MRFKTVDKTEDNSEEGLLRPTNAMMKASSAAESESKKPPHRAACKDVYVKSA
jgi:hypothetical protein